MKLYTHKMVTLATLASGLVFTSFASAGNVANTKHNLSYSGINCSVYKSNVLNQYHANPFLVNHLCTFPPSGV